MNYWEDKIRAAKQFCSDDHELAVYVQGIKEGIRAYAVWKDGVEVVGVSQTPMRELFTNIDAIARTI